MGIGAFLSIAFARKFLIAWAVLVSACVAVAAGLIIPKEYEATAKVQVDSVQKNLVTGLFEPRVRVSEFLGQQAAVAGSRTVALQVIDTLTAEGYFAMSDFEAQWRRKTGGELVPGNDARLWAADELIRKLTVRADALESTIQLTFRSENPSQSARIANAFANAYMQIILDQRQRRSARNAANFDEETLSLERDLDLAQRELTDFREESGIVGIGAERVQAAEVELASLTARLAEAQGDLSEARSLLRQAQSSGASALLTLPLPDDAQTGRQAQSRLGAVLLQVRRLAERYGERYPDYIEAVNEKTALQRTILSAIEDRTTYAQNRVFALEASLNEKKQDVVELQKIKQQYDVLEQKVTASRETYDLVATRSLQESLQSRVDFVELLLLSRAVPATRPSTPPLFVIVLIGIFAGGALGAAAAVALELLEGRIRRAQALAHILKAPIVATLDAPVKSPMPKTVSAPKKRRAAPRRKVLKRRPA